MSLSPEQIKRLLAKPAKKARKSKGIDTNVRDLQTWFKLAPKALDSNVQSLRCENPNCVDLRPPIISATGVEIKSQFCVELKGQLICRRCFLDGWLLHDPAQTSIND